MANLIRGLSENGGVVVCGLLFYTSDAADDMHLFESRGGPISEK